MASNIRARMAQLLTSHRRHVRYLGVLSVIAVFVACGVALSLRQQCITMVRELTVLDCPYSGDGAHMHDASCYDSNGNLVCPLEERELHTHDESCYTEERVLVCGQEEREGHAHTEECYDEDGNLICELEETDGHQHTDDCYQVKRTLTCGQDEVTEVHVHGPGCFKTIVLDDGKSNGSTTSVTSAEQTLLKDLTERDENDDEKLLMSIKVKAPAGTLPKDSAVEVRPLKDDQAEQATTEIEALLRRELGDDVVVKRVQTAQVELVDAQGKKVTPNGNVQVGAWTDFVRDVQELVIVHLADEGDPKHPAAELVSDALLVNWDENDQTTGNENTLQFWMNRPSMAIAIVEVESASPSAEGVIVASRDDQLTTEDALDLDLDSTDSEDSETSVSVDYPAQDFEDHAGNLTVMVSAPQGAFPADTTMQVEAVDTKDVQDAVSSAVPGMVDTVAAVDITFHDAEGMEVKPAELIKVTMTNDEPLVDGIPIVLHVDNEGEASVVAKSAIVSSSDEVSFDADALPTYVMAVKKLQQTLTASDGRTYEITVTYTEEAGLPEDAELVVRELTEADNGYKQTFDRAKATAMSGCKGATINSVRFFDIALVKDGVTLEPLAPVEVNIVMTSGIGLSDATSVVHFVNSRKVELLESEVTTAGDDGETGVGVTFTTESFSIFGVVEMTLEKYVLASDGQTYHVTVTYDTNADIPRNARLAVDEIVAGDTEDEDAYGDYLARAESALGWDAGSATYARLFDIKIVDGSGNKVELSAPVNVTIELDDKGTEAADTQVMHFADGADAPDVIQGVSVEGEAVSFSAEGFSVYAIVDMPAPIETENWQKIANVGELAEHLADGVYIHSPNNYYLTNQSGVASDNNKTAGILKTGVISVPDNAVQVAGKYYFSPVAGTTNQFLIYCMDADGNPQYVKRGASTANDLVFVSQDQATAFTVEAYPGQANTFRIGEGGHYFNMWQGNNGKIFAAWNQANDSNNRLQFEYFKETEHDIYHLEGKTYGLAYHNDTAAAAALMAQTKDATHLVATDMLMRPDVIDNDGILLVAANSDITDWTFHCEQGDYYYLTAVVDGQTVYLCLTDQALTLSGEKTDNCVFRVMPGTDANAGKFRLVNGSYSIELNLNNGSTSRGFWGTKSNSASRWLNLVERSVLGDDDFRLYTAQKVSISDTDKVTSGQKYIIYTRVWNDTKKRYEFFAIDADGSLVPCYDVGDNIEWTGSQINTALWTFTEYFNSDGTPSYYYELTNSQYGNIIAPQLVEGTVMSDSPVGINLNGRRHGENYSTIIAWDEANYAYSGLKVENGRVVPCALAEADDFYFAVLTTTDDHLSTVATIDSDAYGISMRMVDYNNAIKKKDGSAGNNTTGRDSGQTEVLGYDTNVAGLLSTTINPDTGYPDTNPANTGQAANSLSALYEGTTPVNHLFLQSIYNESGYFEYDSTQTFAHLNSDGTFTVYNQLGTVQESINSGNHGQFFPYNDLTEGKYSSVTNQTDVLDGELPDTDPRKGEKLYSVGTRLQTDYFFGMELEASFTQTPSGLDAWGHDIIFEFSGDDDFWLYVDNELILDLGGVHKAQTGTVNFRTGQITSSRGNSTIYNTVKANYQAREMSEAEIEVKLAEMFEQNDEGNYVFKDYTNHTMKIYYMERGAGASNLRMRFNLAAVKPGTFTLSKSLSGTESASNNLIEFPYQIWYTSSSDSQEHLLSDPSRVTYQGTSNRVTYRESFTPAGGTGAYESVFMLRPGQVAEVDLPDDALNYRVVECAVNDQTYDAVKANGETLTGTQSEVDASRKDFSTSSDTLENRSQVTYDNHVSEGAMRSMTITKKLYDTDGRTELTYPENETTFTFRLYLGNEFADPDALPLAYLYAYLVKDVSGNYCQWDATSQRFVAVQIAGAPTSDYEALKAYLATLTDAQKESIVFSTSPNGSIAQIPAGYSVEVHDLIAGTQFKVEERDYEIPKGYKLRLEDGYQRTDEGHQQNTLTTPISGTMAVGETPAVLVSNQKGWGLTARKVWTDKDFMASHDPIYFAIYVRDENDELTLLRDSVRKLVSPTTEVYYFFDNLENGIPFANYVIREVTCTESTGADGTPVYSNVQSIEPDDTLTIGGTPVGGSYAEDYGYKVSYTVGEQTTKNENIRTDTVTNARPGIEFVKTDLSGNPLAGATFTLKDASGSDVAAARYVSDTDGKITIAYLSAGTYTLSETGAPKGYVAIPEAVTITVSDDGTVTATGPEDLYEIEDHPEGGMTARITVKDRTSSFVVKKVDADEGTALAGAHFALYPQVEDDQGRPVKDNKPLAGYADLVTDENGVLEKIGLGLGARTYYLQETQAPEDYDLLTEDLVFTIGEDGTVTVDVESQRGWLTTTTDPKTGQVSYLIEVPDSQQKEVSFKKVDVESPQSVALEGAEFDLYRIVGGEREKVCSLVSGSDGMLVNGSQRTFRLAAGTYHLIETKAPDGYVMKAEPVVITVGSGNVTYDEGTALSSNGKGVTSHDGVYLILISNSRGFELPSTGSSETIVRAFLGATLLLGGAAALLQHRRKLVDER